MMKSHKLALILFMGKHSHTHRDDDLIHLICTSYYTNAIMLSALITGTWKFSLGIHLEFVPRDPEPISESECINVTLSQE